MHPVLASIPVTGIILSGHFYVFCAEKDPGWDPGPIDQLYVITREEDILPALELELCMILAECYELRQFIRCAEILDGCHEFRFHCWDKAANKEIGYSLFLHRLPTLAEKLAWARETITIL
jgi:hypothetical protein